MSDDMIAALLHELERHEMAGRSERADDIRAELTELGVKPPKATPIETADAPRASSKK